MSHLGDRLAALVDGELDHATRDRVLAHVMLCPECRGDVEAHRTVKQRLVAASRPAPPSPDLNARLCAIAAQPPLRSAPRRSLIGGRPRPSRAAARPTPRHAPASASRRPAGTRLQRTRLVAAGTFSVFALAVGATAVVNAPAPRAGGASTPTTAGVVPLPGTATQHPGSRQSVMTYLGDEPVLRVQNAGLVGRTGYGYAGVTFEDVPLTTWGGR